MTARMRTVLLVILLATSACKSSHDRAVAATKKACGELFTTDTNASCETLAERTRAIAQPYADVSNEKDLAPADDDYLSACFDRIEQDHDRCKDNVAYKAAIDALFLSAAE